MNRSVLTATVKAALDATGASSGWLVVAEADVLVVAAAGGATGASPGDRVDQRAPAAIAIATGQPASRSIAPSETAADGAGGCIGMPAWLLTVPFGDGAAALELARHAEQGAFTIDDIEIVSLLADVAESALDAGEAAVPSPDDLAGELRRLHSASPERYRIVASALTSMLGAS
ncbi:MAG: hypothetical protein Q7V88_02665 [Actinomycetota bacterium]|nr:hypothetical protein [Actinomycetota bacterium]